MFIYGIYSTFVCMCVLYSEGAENDDPLQTDVFKNVCDRSCGGPGRRRGCRRARRRVMLCIYTRDRANKGVARERRRCAAAAAAAGKRHRAGAKPNPSSRVVCCVNIFRVAD